MINGLLELLTTKKWMMQPEALDALRQVVQQNLNGHVTLGQFSKQAPYHMAMLPEQNVIGRVSASESGVHEVETVEQTVAIIPVCGPITRNGDACSYGSIDVRNAIIAASNDDRCKGVVLYINTPGGACSAIPDFKYGIDYARNCNKKVYAFVDGMAASCGMYLAALCDKRYYMNPKDQIGSIGVMAAFYTTKDGEKNQYTNETFHALYATQSPAKNKWFRDASEGDYTELQADLDKTCDEFHADVKASCPNVKSEHLDGTLFDAQDVDGILMDGQSTLEEVVGMILSGDSGQSGQTGNSGNSGQSSNSGQTANSNNTTINMNNYPLIIAALGVEDLHQTEEGAFVNAPLLDALEQKLDAYEKAEIAAAKAAEESQKKVDEIDASLKSAEEKIADLTAQLAKAAEDKEASDKALAEANAKYASQLTEAKEVYDKALAEKDADIKAGADVLANVQKELDGAKSALATAEQQIADKDAQIASLTSAPAQSPDAGATPENNGGGAEQAHVVCKAPQWGDYDSAEAFNKAMDEYLHS